MQKTFVSPAGWLIVSLGSIGSYFRRSTPPALPGDYPTRPLMFSTCASSPPLLQSLCSLCFPRFLCSRWSSFFVAAFLPPLVRLFSSELIDRTFSCLGPVVAFSFFFFLPLLLVVVVVFKHLVSAALTDHMHLDSSG